MSHAESADDWFASCVAWTDEVAALRVVLLAAGLDETLKWRQPCYTDRGKNIVLISVMPDAAVVSFLKGALLEDPEDRLIVPGPNSRSARYVRFVSLDEVRDGAEYLGDLVRQAVDAERVGRRVEPLPDAIDYCDELQQRLAADPVFRDAFEALTAGRRRGYNLHIGAAKQASTREARIDRHMARILAGKGIHDCICGRSQRMPRCDGSHAKEP